MPHFRKNKLALSIALISVTLAGCSITPKPLTIDEQRILMRQDRIKAQSDVEPIGDFLSLHEAVARGLKYNLNHRTKILEQAIATGTYEVSKFDMLPKVLASAGYNYRNNYFTTRATDSVTGQPSLNNPFISSEKTYGQTGLMLSWSLLDFGVSYFNARQNADRIIVASERRRRTMHVLVQDIQAAYLRAAAAQKLKKQIENTIAEATLALKNSVQVEKDGLRPPLDALKYQKALLDNVKILETIDLELGTAKVELNLLINLPAKESLKLEDPDDLTVPNDYSHEDTEEFEVRAILANAELNESIYNARIAVEDTRKSLLRLFPGLTFNVGPQRSDNEYYVNKSWVEGSANISFNLWNLLSAPETIKLADQSAELAAQKRMTVQMAVISQVHLSKIQLNNSSHIYKRSAEIDAVNTRISRITSAKYTEGAASRAEKVAADAAAIVSKLQKYQALSQLFAASGKMQASTGMEPYFESLDEIPLFDMTNKVASSFREWNSGLMPAMPESVPTELPVLTTLIMPEDPSIEMPVVRAKKSNSDSQNQQPNGKKSSNKDAPLLGNILKPWAATSTAKNGNTNKGQAPNQKAPKPISPFQGWGTPPSGGAAKKTSTVSDSRSGESVNTVANNK